MYMNEISLTDTETPDRESIVSFLPSVYPPLSHSCPYFHFNPSLVSSLFYWHIPYAVDNERYGELGSNSKK